MKILNKLKIIHFSIAISYLAGNIAYAENCSIKLIDSNDYNEHRLYEVNNKNITVILEKGIVLRVIGYSDNPTIKQTAYIVPPNICLEPEGRTCQELVSLSDEDIINPFLKYHYCK